MRLLSAQLFSKAQTFLALSKDACICLDSLGSENSGWLSQHFTNKQDGLQQRSNMGLDLIAFYVQGNYLPFTWMPFHYGVYLFLSLFWPPKETSGLPLRGGRCPESPWAWWPDYLLKHVFSLFQFDFLEAHFFGLFLVLQMCVVSFFSDFLSTRFRSSRCCCCSLGLLAVPTRKGLYPSGAFPGPRREVFTTEQLRFLQNKGIFQNFQENISIFSLVFAFWKILRIK